MKYAAIDIGSNAVRLLIKEARVPNNGKVQFSKISLTRVPIRLGADVFSKGSISAKNAKKLSLAVQAFQYLMKVNEVEIFRVCATSAMREANNGNEVVKSVLKTTGVKIEIIDGKEEAELIFSNSFTSNLNPSEDYLFIDVGGGSTELTHIKNNQSFKSNSFKIGTVRLLNDKVKPKVWEELKCWSKEVKNHGAITAIGTGGNINRLFKECSHKFQDKISYKNLKDIAEFIENHSTEERINKLKFRPDRADVIVPACKIYLTAMKAAAAGNMIVPKMGLADGIIYKLHSSGKE